MWQPETAQLRQMASPNRREVDHTGEWTVAAEVGGEEAAARAGRCRHVPAAGATLACPTAWLALDSTLPLSQRLLCVPACNLAGPACMPCSWPQPTPYREGLPIGCVRRCPACVGPPHRPVALPSFFLFLAAAWVRSHDALSADLQALAAMFAAFAEQLGGGKAITLAQAEAARRFAASFLHFIRLHNQQEEGEWVAGLAAWCGVVGLAAWRGGVGWGGVCGGQPGVCATSGCDGGAGCRGV